MKRYFWTTQLTVQNNARYRDWLIILWITEILQLEVSSYLNKMKLNMISLLDTFLSQLSSQRGTGDPPSLGSLHFEVRMGPLQLTYTDIVY
jgi:regulator of PEP synthase PpsR (kinase-PPPase family)